MPAVRLRIDQIDRFSLYDQPEVGVPPSRHRFTVVHASNSGAPTHFFVFGGIWVDDTGASLRVGQTIDYGTLRGGAVLRLEPADERRYARTQTPEPIDMQRRRKVNAWKSESSSLARNGKLNEALDALEKAIENTDDESARAAESATLAQCRKAVADVFAAKISIATLADRWSFGCRKYP